MPYSGLLSLHLLIPKMEHASRQKWLLGALNNNFELSIVSCQLNKFCQKNRKNR